MGLPGPRRYGGQRISGGEISAAHQRCRLKKNPSGPWGGRETLEINRRFARFPYCDSFVPSQ